MRLYRMGFCCTQGQAASGILPPPPCPTKSTAVWQGDRNFLFLPQTWYLYGVGGHSSLPEAAQWEQHLPPAVTVVSGGASFPVLMRELFHFTQCGGLAHPGRWCAVLRSITPSWVGKPNTKYLKILFNLAGVLAIKASFQCPQWVLEPVIELNREVSFPSYQLLYSTCVWRSHLIIPTSFMRRLCPADSGWRPSAHQKPLPIQGSPTLSCPAGGLRNPCTPWPPEMLGVGSTAPSNHVLIVGGGSGAGAPLSWRGGNGQQCFSRRQLFSSPEGAALLYTAHVKEEDVALH